MRSVELIAGFMVIRNNCPNKKQVDWSRIDDPVRITAVRIHHGQCVISTLLTVHLDPFLTGKSGTAVKISNRQALTRARLKMH